MSAHPTFPTASRKYHGIGALSLLCSEWEEVGHARIEHRRQKVVRVSARISARIEDEFAEMRADTLTPYCRF